MVTRFHTYRAKRFGIATDPFDQVYDPSSPRPPVFSREEWDLNVLTHPSSRTEETDRTLNLLPPAKRHRWFASMKSSQALTLSVFGSLVAHDKLQVLASLKRDDGEPLFFSGGATGVKCSLEYDKSRKLLNESAPTEVDVFIEGETRVAVECKFTESSVGNCSRPEAGKCSGDYEEQSDHGERCYLTARKIEYWHHIPELFKWSSEADMSPCPLRETYQLVRNVLAATLATCEESKQHIGHVVLVYDSHNPAFQSGGKGMSAWDSCKRALKYPQLLQKCTWQNIVGVMREDDDLYWLVDALHEKYGF